MSELELVEFKKDITLQRTRSRRTTSLELVEFKKDITFKLHGDCLILSIEKVNAH